MRGREKGLRKQDYLSNLIFFKKEGIEVYLAKKENACSNRLHKI